MWGLFQYPVACTITGSPAICLERLVCSDHLLWKKFVALERVASFSGGLFFRSMKIVVDKKILQSCSDLVTFDYWGDLISGVIFVF